MSDSAASLRRLDGTNRFVVGGGVGAAELPSCDHDWRVNPVVCSTTATGDCELWLCVKCKTQATGPRLSSRPQSKVRVSPFDPTTWEKR